MSNQILAALPFQAFQTFQSFKPYNPLFISRAFCDDVTIRKSALLSC